MISQKYEKRIFDTLCKFSPIQSTYLGIHKWDCFLDDISPTGIDFTKSVYTNLLSEISTLIDEDSLTLDNKIDLTLVSDYIESYLLIQKSIQPFYRNPVIYPQMITNALYFIILRNYLSTDDQSRSLNARIKCIPAFIFQAKTNLESGLRQSLKIPTIWTRISLDTTQGTLSFIESVLIPFTKSIGIYDIAFKKRLDDACHALADYKQFLETSILPKTTDQFSMPLATYKKLFKLNYRLAIQPSDVVKLGQKLKKETLVRIKTLVEQTPEFLNFKNDWVGILDKIKSSHPTADELIPTYQSAMENAKAFTRDHNIATLIEAKHINVIETPEFERHTMPLVAYEPPAPFASNKQTDSHGDFWVTPPIDLKTGAIDTKRLKGHSHASILIKSVHEAYPGHHHQLNHATTHSSKIRKLFMSPLFAEGWALYCEEMMGDEGYYTSPEVTLMQYKDTLWRCCRAIIDVELHTGKMTVDDAVEMLVIDAKLERDTAIAEVNRYCLTPIQPCSYLLGKIEIKKIRDAYFRKHPDKNLKSFHDELLRHGTIPFAYVVKLMGV